MFFLGSVLLLSVLLLTHPKVLWFHLVYCNAGVNLVSLCYCTKLEVVEFFCDLVCT